MEITRGDACRLHFHGFVAGGRDAVQYSAVTTYQACAPKVGDCHGPRIGV